MKSTRSSSVNPPKVSKDDSSSSSTFSSTLSSISATFKAEMEQMNKNLSASQEAITIEMNNKLAALKEETRMKNEEFQKNFDKEVEKRMALQQEENHKRNEQFSKDLDHRLNRMEQIIRQQVELLNEQSLSNNQTNLEFMIQKIDAVSSVVSESTKATQSSFEQINGRVSQITQQVHSLEIEKAKPNTSVKNDPRSLVSPIIPSSELDLGPSPISNDISSGSGQSRSSLKKSFYGASSSTSSKSESSSYRTGGSKSRSTSRPPTRNADTYAIGSLDDDNRDKYIDDTENIGTLPSNDFSLWAKACEDFYPYSQYPHLYKGLYSLLSHHGRVRNYIMFASRVNFNQRIYPSDCLNHAYYLLEVKYKVPPFNGRSRRNPVPTHRLNQLPGLDHSYSEGRISIVNGWDNDLHVDTELFSSIPREVVLGDKPILKVSTLPTMEQEIKLYAGNRYNMIIGLLPEGVTPDTATDEQMKLAWSLPKTSRTIKSISDNISKVTPTGANNNSSGSGSSSSINTSVSVKSEVLPRLENPYDSGVGVDSLNLANLQELSKRKEQESGPEANSEGMQYLRRLVGDDVMVQLDVVTVAMIKSVHNPKQLTNTERIKVVGEIQRGHTPAVYDGTPMERAPQFYMELLIAISKYTLDTGDIITIMSSKFGTNLQSWLNNEIINISTVDDKYKIPIILKNFRRQFMGQRLILDIQRKLRDTQLLVAPATQEELNLHYATWNKYKVALCMCDSTYTDTRLMLEFLGSFPPSLTSGIPLNGAGLKTINDAWNIISITASSYYDRLRTQASYRMMVNKVKTESNTNALYLSHHDYNVEDIDDYLKEEEYQSTHVNAVSSRRMNNYNKNNNSTRTAKVNSERRGKESYVAQEEKYHDEDSADGMSEEEDSFAQVTFVHAFRRLVPMDKQDMKCFHCGIKGHMVGECEIAKKNLPQTTKGQMAWAEFCKLRGEARVYDVRYQLERHEQWQKRKRYNERGNQRTFNRNRPTVNDESSDSEVTFRDEALSSGVSGKDEINDRHQRLTRSKDKSRDVTTVSNAIYAKSDIDISESSEVDNEDGTSGSGKVIFRVSHLGTSMVEDIKEAEEREKLVASSICLPIEIITDNMEESVIAGHALGDQGCIQTLIRRKHKDKILPNVAEQTVHGHYVVGATSELELPVSAKFPAILSSNGKLLGNKKTVIYIVEDNGDNSIMCDMIIGRPTIAESDYHCIDTRDGTLFNKQHPHRQVQCSPACFVKTKRGGVVLPKELRATMKSKRMKKNNKL